MTHKEKVDYVRDQIISFDQLERKSTSLVGWIMLKLSCSHREAEKLIDEAGK